MKKRLIISSIIFVIISIFIVCFSLYMTRGNVFHITTIKKTYSLVSNYKENENFEVLLYISDKKAYAVNIDKISECKITDKEGNESIAVKIVSITDKYEAMKINNNKYFLYSFIFNVDLKTDSDLSFEIKDALLVMKYPNFEQDVIEVSIGNFYYYKIPYYGDIGENLVISKIKPLVNYIGYNKSLAGIDFQFYNQINNDIVINKIEVLNGDVVIGKNDICIIDEDFSSGENIDNILGYNYDYYDNASDNGNYNIVIKSGEIKEVLFPLKYSKEVIVDQLGLIIHYSINGESFKVYYDDFVFFKQTSIKINADNLEIKTYEHA